MEATAVDQAKAAAEKRRRDAAERYCTLLRRNTKPKPGDAAAVQECLVALGRSVADLADDVGLVAELVRIERAERTVCELEQPIAEAKRKLLAARARAEEKMAKLKYENTERIRSAQAARARLLADRAVAAAVVVGGPAARDSWNAICEGLSAAEVRRRRPGREPAEHAERAREDVIADCKKRLVTLRTLPVVNRTPEGVVELVSKELAAAGHGPLTPEEIAEHGIEGWLKQVR